MSYDTPLFFRTVVFRYSVWQPGHGRGLQGVPLSSLGMYNM
jgi:hypothetical protein